MWKRCSCVPKAPLVKIVYVLLRARAICMFHETYLFDKRHTWLFPREVLYGNTATQGIPRI